MSHASRSHHVLLLSCVALALAGCDTSLDRTRDPLDGSMRGVDAGPTLRRDGAPADDDCDGTIDEADGVCIASTGGIP